MTIEDITLDTNVLMHADNPNEIRFEASKSFLERLLEVETHLCIDEGFSLDEGENKSLIGHEYLQRLSQGGLGYAVISFLAQTGRVAIVEKRIPPAVVNKINQLISNKRDKTFIRVAYNSTTRTLVSHDFADFSGVVREKLRKKLCLRIEDAQGVLPELLLRA